MAGIQARKKGVMSRTEQNKGNSKKRQRDAYAPILTFINNIKRETKGIKYAENKEWEDAYARRVFVKTKEASQLAREYKIEPNEFKRVLYVFDELARLKIEKRLTKEQYERVNKIKKNFIKELEKEGKIRKRDSI